MNVKTAEPIGPKFFVRLHITEKVCDWLELEKKYALITKWTKYILKIILFEKSFEVVVNFSSNRGNPEWYT